jgi:positive regulator of sigma E activity
MWWAPPIYMTVGMLLFQILVLDNSLKESALLAAIIGGTWAVYGYNTRPRQRG